MLSNIREKIIFKKTRAFLLTAVTRFLNYIFRLCSSNVNKSIKMTETEPTTDQNQKPEVSGTLKAPKKEPKRGIIYLSTIPPYMNVTKIREVFGDFGKLGRVYLQLTDAAVTKGKGDEKIKKKRKATANKFTEGWIEFERKSVAKKVALHLNNTQVSSRKGSKQFDCIWNIKYLSNFKWTHLHERLAYERAARKQKLRAEIQLAKKKTNFFTANLDKKKRKNRQTSQGVDNENSTRNEFTPTSVDIEASSGDGDRNEFLKSLFS